MPRGRFNVLRDQTRRMVYAVLTYMKKEAEDGLEHDLKAPQKRTAAATGVSVKTVRRIAMAANEAGTNQKDFRTPGKKRSGKKRVTGINSFEQGIIKRCIHNFHNTENELPTINQLLKKIKNDINFKGSATSLRRILKDLGFKWIKTEDNRKLLVEHTNIRYKRIEYLRKIAKYRAEGRPIVFTGESYIDSSHFNKNVYKGQCIIAHAGTEAGFVPDALLMFSISTKCSDKLRNMGYENYEKWVCTQLIPNLPENSIVVIDNAAHHNKLEDARPTSNSKKSEMESWLLENNIPFSTSMLKPELYKLICLNKDRSKKYQIDRILQKNNHTVLRLPPYHPDLNPMEMVCTAIKDYIAEKKISWDINSIMKLVEEKVYTIGENEWVSLCGTVRSIEAEYNKSDVVIDNLIEEFVIYVSDDDSDEDTVKEEDTDSDEKYNDSFSEEDMCSE